MGRNNQRANDLIKQARISTLGLSKKNESFLLEMDSLIESIDLFVKKNKEDDIRLILDQVEDLIIDNSETSALSITETMPSFTVDGLRVWTESKLESFKKNWSSIILIKSKSSASADTLDVEILMKIKVASKINILE